MFFGSIESITDLTIGQMPEYKARAPSYCMATSKSTWTQDQTDAVKLQQLLLMINTWLLCVHFDDFAWVRSGKVYLMIRHSMDMPCWGCLSTIMGHRIWATTGYWAVPTREHLHPGVEEMRHWDDSFTMVSRSQFFARDGPSSLKQKTNGTERDAP